MTAPGSPLPRRGDRAPRLRWARPAPPPEGIDFDAIRAEFDVPGDFAPAVLAEAQAAAPADDPDRADFTALPLATVDPAGSRDLDQAMHLARDGSGFVVHYAIADVAAFVRPGGSLDRAAHERVETYYLPDRRSPLHPPQLSEGAASLLPGQRTPAVVWQIALDETGAISDVDVRRGLIESVRQWDYPELQAVLDGAASAAGAAGGLALLGEVGRLRQEQARRRGAIELDLPEQIVVGGGAQPWSLQLRRDLPCEVWNAHISLLTGMAAASLMLGAGVGILRTLPPADERTLAQLRRFAATLGIPWPAAQPPGEMLAGLDRADPVHVALIEEAATLLRGAGYTVLESALPADDPRVQHAGVAAPYAHVTAPLRRLVDRYGSEVCLAIAAGRPVPAWTLDALPELPGEMAAGDRRARAVERAVIDALEAWLLRDRVGQTFAATVLESAPDGRSAEIEVADPPVRARAEGAGLEPGATINARLTKADPATREVRFAAS